MAGEDDLVTMSFGDEEEVGGEVVVQLPADTSAPVVRVEGATPAPKPTDTEDPLDSLKSQFATLSQRASAAEQRAAQAEQQVQQATQRVQHMETQIVGSQLDTVLSGIAAAEAEALAAEQEYTAAFDSGDGAAMARAHRKIAGAEARRLRLAEAKDDLEEAAKRRPVPQPQTHQRPPQRQQTGNPVEDFIRANQLSPRSAAFIRKHPETTSDQRANARMMAAHNMAVADGVEIESDEYFRRIEEGIAPVTKKESPPQQQRQTRPSSAAASASGGGNGGAALNGGVEVALTRGEAKSATDGTLVWNYPDPSGQNRWKVGDPIGLAEMARRKMEGKKRGLYDRSFTEQ